MTLKIEESISVEQISDFILRLCDFPESFVYNTTNTQARLNILSPSMEQRLLVRAKLQESLRIRFSHPEVKKSNQRLIKILEPNPKEQSK